MNNDLWWLWIVLFFIVVAILIWLWGRRKSETRDNMARPMASEAETVRPLSETRIPAAAEPLTAPAAEIKVDDLKIIEGIGPKIARLLIENEIASFEALAAAAPEQLEKILADAGLSHLASPATWPKQAELAAAGKWEELKEYQTTLKGGRAA